MARYQNWNPEQQELFLDYCTGQKGVKVLYDPAFKEILNPEATPERVEEFLSLLLNQKVRILHVLPPDSPRMGDVHSLVILDLVVELEGGRIVNLEVQRMGYRFPGQRAACYSADLLLRQYQRVRSQKGKSFSYRDIQKVCTIVLYDRSPEVFHQFPEDYRHHFSQQSDTGLEMDLLQEYWFVPLDIFREILHNVGIRGPLEAWLTFLGTDDPETIETRINAYPAFRPYYQEIYDLCRNTERVMEMFSKELQELDQNTVQYMIDEMQETLEEQKRLLAQSQEIREQQQDTIRQQQDTIDHQRKQLKEQADAFQQEIRHLKALLDEKR